MEFPKKPDASFTWIIDNFRENYNFLNKLEYSSPNFTTSCKAKRTWHLTILKDWTRLQLKCNDCIQKSLDFKVDFSIVTAVGKIYTRSLFILDDKNNEDCFTISYFPSFEALKQVVSDTHLEILTEMRFLNKGIQRKSLNDLLAAEIPTDIELSVGGSQFSAHKVILASSSPFFYEAFLQKKEINLDDVNPATFSEILNYMYTGEIENWSLASEILFESFKLQMDNLRYTCEQWLGKNLSKSNVFSLLKLADKYNAFYLENCCFYFITVNGNALSSCKNFNSIGSEPGLVLTILRNIIYKSQLRKMNEFYLPSRLYSHRTTRNICFDPFNEYESFLNSSILSDIEIRVGDKKYQCHKLILAARSSVFRGMLTTEMKEALTNLIEIKDVNPDVFYELLRYMYTGNIKNQEKLTYDILKAADKYDLEHLKQICEDVLIKDMDMTNVFSLLRLVYTHNASFLKQCSIQFILREMIEKNSCVMEVLFFLEYLVKTHPHVAFNILEVLCSCVRR